LSYSSKQDKNNNALKGSSSASPRPVGINVLKREGNVQPFDKNKLTNSMIKAGASEQEANKVTNRVASRLVIRPGSSNLLVPTSQLSSMATRSLSTINPVAAKSYADFKAKESIVASTAAGGSASASAGRAIDAFRATIQPRPEFNGLRVKKYPADPAVYLIDQGCARCIPNEQVYNALFLNWNGIIDVFDLSSIPRGPDIPETAILFRCAGRLIGTDFGTKHVEGDPTVYLLDGTPPNLVKRGIVSLEVFNRYNFDMDKVHDLETPTKNVSYYPDGPLIQ
jgi:hypothetical protein